MENMIYKLSNLPEELYALAGFEASLLARMSRLKLPVAAGIVILPPAFKDPHQLSNLIQSHLREYETNKPGIHFSIRPSLCWEDSFRAYFSGKIQSVHDLYNTQAITDSAYQMVQALDSDTIKKYCQKHQINHPISISVIVQEYAASDISGRILTAHPVSGSHEEIPGYYTNGNISQLTDTSTAKEFYLYRPDGNYKGPHECKSFATQLFNGIAKLDMSFPKPLELEWYVKDNKLLFNYGNVIPTINGVRLDTYEMNDSLNGDYLWSGNNTKEVLPDVMSPFTWSMIRKLDVEYNEYPNYYDWSGNIYGRAYSNISVPVSVPPALGFKEKSAFGNFFNSDVYGNIPVHAAIPLYPFPKWPLRKEMFKRGKKYIRRLLNAKQQTYTILRQTNRTLNDVFESMETTDIAALYVLWHQKLLPSVAKLWSLWQGHSGDLFLIRFRKKLVALIGEEETNCLLSDFSGDFNLESLGPLLGIEKLYEKSMTRDEYRARYGHRSPHEMEMAKPYPFEDSHFITQQLVEYESANMNIKGTLEEQHEQYKTLVAAFCHTHKSKGRWLVKHLRKLKKAAQTKDLVYSELIRSFMLTRLFLLQAGKATGIGKSIFFLYEWEIGQLLSGETYMVANIPKRKENYEIYQDFPPFPYVFKGKFDPAAWVKEVDKDLTYYDPYAEPHEGLVNNDVITGFAGAPVMVEGIVRVLKEFEETSIFKPGEILVTTSVNTGWSFLFPKAAAIITDIGAPLSAGAIIARELGIPAIVGCGNATALLKTGDKVLVDGSKGYITKLGNNYLD